MPKELPIILVNYNGYEYTKACLESIRHSEINPLPFVIIVDNASSGRIDEIVNFYPKIYLIKNKENIGFGRANNMGINWAKKHLDFDYLLFLNNDTLIEKNSLSYLIKAFENNPEIGITTSKIMYEETRDIVWYGGGDINYKRGWPKIIDFKQKATVDGADKPRFVTFVSGCVMMFSKKCLEKVVGFDDDFFMYCEDLELSMRASRLGFKLYYEPKSIVYHKVQGSMRNQNKDVVGLNTQNPNLSFMFYHMKSNQFLAMKKNLSFLSFWIFKFVFWLEFIYLTIKFVINGRWDFLPFSIKTIKRICNGSIE